VSVESKGHEPGAFQGPVWEGVYSNFREVPVVGPGFDSETWIANSLKKIAAVREEAARSAPLPTPANYREALLPLLAAMVRMETGRVRILDFGGGLGFAYYQVVCGLPRQHGVEYHIVERDAVCRAGKQFFSNTAENIHFHSELPGLQGVLDIVHLGSSIHYVEDWRLLLTRLCALAPKYVLLVDVPAGNIPTFATAQNYYGSKIPAWFLNIQDLLPAISSRGYELTFTSSYQPRILGVEQPLPMQNFADRYRLSRTSNLLFAKNVSGASAPHLEPSAGHSGPMRQGAI